ncbi:CocE/NonD family hydrolase [Mesorhizobium sp. IMUNJ 23232]|uniref:CocE/NonD family hydrolase n=1 Tax=Mesorhizobium sp. IMUNJ 23232 TaxID=3376064 RepID=UPI00378A3FD8
MKTVTQFPRKIVENPDVGIEMPDGCVLSARIWLPADAEATPVPAILEHLPYRKRDGTTARDSLTHPYFAGHGYASIRVDMRGNGDSEGLMEDEYTEQELEDAVAVIEWAAKQPWCNGKVGMMGISWGGFNSLQVAAKQPEALKAIITLCSTDDRYADDIHYKGGLLLNENLGWGSTMLSYSSRSPDPAIVGDSWKEMWLERLENEPFLPAVWLRHQRRDDYWKRGSVCEDFSKIRAATLAVGGWGDGYKNAVARLVAGIGGPTKGIIGPWIHKYPHFAVPKPAIGFLQEALRWWDFWLKGKETGVENDPVMRLYLMDSVPPRDWYEERPGRWIAEHQWPSPGIATRSFSLAAGGKLSEGPAKVVNAKIKSPQDCGMDGGEYCAIWLGPEMPGDQRADDAKSACFDVGLTSSIDIVGAPVVRLTLFADRPVAMVAVRLCDVHPDGSSTRITYGVFNLCHRDGHETPKAIKPTLPMTVAFKLDDIAYQVPAGHILRVAVSSAYWPLVWPSPEPVTLNILTGSIDLPERAAGQGDEVSFEDPEAARPWNTQTIRPASNSRKVERDEKTGAVTLAIVDDFGETRDANHGLINGGIARERWTIHPNDPLSARGVTHWTAIHKRDGWSLRTETFSAMRSDATAFHLTGRIEAYEDDVLVYEKDFREEVPRDHI